MESLENVRNVIVSQLKSILKIYLKFNESFIGTVLRVLLYDANPPKRQPRRQPLNFHLFLKLVNDANPYYISMISIC